MHGALAGRGINLSCYTFLKPSGPKPEANSLPAKQEPGRHPFHATAEPKRKSVSNARFLFFLLVKKILEPADSRFPGATEVVPEKGLSEHETIVF
jgi:hypothetical protein